MLKLFIYMMMEANHKPKKWRGVDIPTGSFISGRLKLSEATGLTEREVRTGVMRMVRSKEITLKTTNKFTLYTIENYRDYQGGCDSATNKRPTNDQQTTTTNNDNNEIKKKKTDTCQNSDEFSPEANGCPYQDIVALYHSVLPELPRVVKITAARKSHVKARWVHDFGDIEEWEKYFRIVSTSDFLMGKTRPVNGGRTFRADFDFLIKESNAVKIIESKYHG